MDLIQFGHSENVIWFGLVFLVVVVYAALLFRQGKNLNRFVSSVMQERLVRSSSQSSKVLRVGCIALSGCAFVVALMQPQIVQQERVSVARESANVFVALDVSKSMLAADVAPNRLERAKSEVRDMLPVLIQHRLGLLAFAGRTTVLSPLTTDHGFFRLVLDSASPESVTLGGTNLGEVIHMATKLLSGQEGPKVLVLITDGEDHDSYPKEAADDAQKAGITIVTIGFGSESGSTIEYVDRKTGVKTRVRDASGRDVVSKLDGNLLREIASKTEGIYVPAGVGVLDLEDIMNKLILPLVEDSEPVHIQEQRIDLFQWFIAIGLFFFVGAMLLEGRGRRRLKKEKTA